MMRYALNNRRMDGESHRDLSLLLGRTSSIPVMGEDDERRLFSLFRKGRRTGKKSSAAREEIVLRSIRLVVRIAASYGGKGVPSSDLFSHGIVGLIKAIDRFDPSRGVRFGSYAVWWIRDEVIKALDDMSTHIRIPGHIRDRMRRMRMVGDGVPIGKVARSLGITRKMAELADAASQCRVSSLDSILGNVHSDSAADIIGDPSPGPDELAMRSDARNVAAGLLGILDARSREVVAMRFGIGRGRPMSFEEIASGIGLSRERVRQIQVRAVEKMRKSLDGGKAGHDAGC